jgi:hypothetical protein
MEAAAQAAAGHRSPDHRGGPRLLRGLLDRSRSCLGPGRPDPSLPLDITAIGGGTVGRSYANSDWISRLWRSGRLHRCGVDLRCGATGKTRQQMAVLLGEYLADDESLDEHTRPRLGA